MHTEDASTFPTTAPGQPVRDRDGLLEDLDRLSAHAVQATLVLVDIDGFARVNQELGRSGGDAVLQAVAMRLRAAAHADDDVASMGGDEFVVVCQHGLAAATAAAEQLCAAVREPLVGGRHDQHLTASVGVAAFDSRASALRNLVVASAAVRLAKERGRNRVEVFDDGLRTVAMDTLTRATELRHAAREGQLRLHFQPVIDLMSGATAGYEGLLRWEHPARGVLPPSEFLAVAESSGLLDELTSELLDQAAAAAAHLSRTAPLVAPYVALNLAARQLAAPGLVRQVRAALARHGVAPGRLMVEITETTVLSDLNQTLSTLRGLADLGVAIALDDFGTGYSSLLHLRRLPVDVVKIDRSFVSGIMRDRSDLAIVAGVIDLAVRLGLRTTAEGVEAEEQALTLRDLGCQAGQGYLWSRAAPLHALPRPTGLGAVDSALRGRQRETVARILRMHAEGASAHTVAAALNAMGLRNDRGRRWHARAVDRVLGSAHHPALRPGGRP